MNFPGFCPSIRITLELNCRLDRVQREIPSRRLVLRLVARSLQVRCRLRLMCRATGDDFRLIDQRSHQKTHAGNSSRVSFGFIASSQNVGRSPFVCSLNTLHASLLPLEHRKMSSLNLQEIHDFAIELAKKAGQMILTASNTRLSGPSTTMAEKKNCPLHPP